MRMWIVMALLVAPSLSGGTVKGRVVFDDDAELRFPATVETFTTGCIIFCSDKSPVTPFEQPLCAEYEESSELIQLATLGDRAAIAQLQERYRTTFTYAERHRIAAALLRRASNDREYWNELATRMEEAIRFADDDHEQEFLAFCIARGVEPGDYRLMTLTAMEEAAMDRRARPFLLRAMESKDDFLARHTLSLVMGLADESLLPRIEKALERFPSGAFSLLWFRSDAADRIAKKFLSADDWEEYEEQRRCETMKTCDP
jgi:hypothetical protein